MKSLRLPAHLVVALVVVFAVIRHFQANAAPTDWAMMNAGQRIADVKQRREAEVGTELKGKGLTLGNEVFIRIMKESSELELWLRPVAGKPFQLYKTWPVARWSGSLGPKLKEGDGQAPEGFYDVVANRMNPMSKYHLSFNIGYPNAFDQALKRTGNLIMVHGSDVSIGCYAMTNPVIEEIYLIVDAALRGGQVKVPVHCFPFRMTSARLATEANSKWHDFWANLKEGYHAFEDSHEPPSVATKNGRYVIGPSDPRRP